MTTERDEITLRAAHDAPAELIDDIKAHNPGTCAGMFWKMGDGSVLPCTGGGMVIRRVEVIKHTIGERERESVAHGVAEILGVETGTKLAPLESMTCRPLSMEICPCTSQKKQNAEAHKILEALGVRTVPKLWPAQKAALTIFRNSAKSFFVYGESGGGKTVFAAACAEQYRGHMHALTGDEISAEWRRFAMENRPLDYFGLLFLDDLDKTVPTEAFKEKLWYIFDRAEKQKLRLFITTNLDPRRFSEIYTAGKNEAQSMIRRLAKLEAIQL